MSATISGLLDGAETFEDFADGIDDAIDDIPDATDRAVGRTTEEIGDAAQAEAPVDEGTLRDSKTVRRISHAVWEVAFPATNDDGVPYARFVEYGRGPVVAKEAAALRFVVDGEVFYRQRVGPAAPQPFVRPALQRHRRTLAENLREEYERTVATALA